MQKMIAVLVGAVLTALVFAASALAAGSCGNDFSGNTACGVASPGGYGGSIEAANEQDFYVFFAHSGTSLALTLTDNEDPGCSLGNGGYCATGDMILYDAQGSDIAHSSYQGPNAQPVNGVNVPASIHQVLDTTGTYYLAVEADLGADSNGSPTPMPYTLGVNASPGVHWPPVPSRVCVTHYHWVKKWVTHRVRRHHRWVRANVRVWIKVPYRSCRTVYS